LAQFFNYVTKNLESVSHDLKEGNRMMSELDLASEIQRSILPRAIPMVDKLDVAARTRPAEEVGGDSFGFMQKGRQTFLYLGDVTGHGAPAGLIMMMVNTLLYVYLEMSNDTKEWLTKTNLTLKPRVNGTMFMTTVALRWDPDLEKMFYTGAGHEHILIFRAYEGVCEAIASGGIALGMTDDISEIAKEKELNLKKDDVVVLYTDGIPEARNQSSEMFTLNRLKDAVTRNGKLGTAAQVFEGIAKDFRAFVGEEPQLDDITLIVMRYTGVPVAEVGKTTETSWGQI
jgi:serine phosphatase RsbU (regulator of sigma subunit)